MIIWFIACLKLQHQHHWMGSLKRLQGGWIHRKRMKSLNHYCPWGFQTAKSRYSTGTSKLQNNPLSNNNLSNPIQNSQISSAFGALHSMQMVLRSRLQPVVETVSPDWDDFIGKELASSLTLLEMDLHLKASHTWYKCHSFLAAPIPPKAAGKQKNPQKNLERGSWKWNQTKPKVNKNVLPGSPGHATAGLAIMRVRNEILKWMQEGETAEKIETEFQCYLSQTKHTCSALSNPWHGNSSRMELRHN